MKSGLTPLNFKTGFLRKNSLFIWDNAHCSCNPTCTWEFRNCTFFLSLYIVANLSPQSLSFPYTLQRLQDGYSWLQVPNPFNLVGSLKNSVKVSGTNIAKRLYSGGEVCTRTSWAASSSSAQIPGPSCGGEGVGVSEGVKWVESGHVGLGGSLSVEQDVPLSAAHLFHTAHVHLWVVTMNPETCQCRHKKGKHFNKYLLESTFVSIITFAIIFAVTFLI